jgi:protein-S-isoprenylcysteine O-methyltransferase Ste14
MAIQVPTSSEPGFTTLVREIVNDVEELVKAQIRFARAEFKEELNKSKEAALLLGSGMVSLFLGTLFLGLMLAHLLHWLTTPPGPGGTELAWLPLWVCHAIVAGIFFIAGAGLCLLGRKMLASFHPVPEQTAQTLKENVEWITNSK